MKRSEEARDLAYAIAQRVEDLRNEQGLSKADLARRAEMWAPNVSRLLAASSLPTLDVVLRVAAALDCTVSVTLTPRARAAEQQKQHPREEVEQ